MTEEAKRREDSEVVPPGMSRAARIGWLMVVFLAIQSAVEYVLSLVLDKNLPIMVVINVTEASAIMIYFMHIPRLWREREEE